jgi:site-specific recombinase XerD
MLAMMTRHVRSFKKLAPAPSTWRELSSPPAANDVALILVPLSRSLPKDPAEISLLRRTLDLKQPSDLRAAALLALLALGLRKHEVVALDLSDLVLVGSVVCVSVRSRRRKDQGKPSFLPVTGQDARVLRQYLTRQHHQTAALTSPLFYGIEHGNDDRRKRITVNALSYWLLEVRLRARQAIAENVLALGPKR